MSSPPGGQILKRFWMTVSLRVLLGLLLEFALVDKVSAGPVTTFTGSTTGVFSDPSGGGRNRGRDQFVYLGRR